MKPSQPLEDDELERLLRDSRQLVDAPLRLVQSAIDLWDRRASRGTHAGAALRRLLSPLLVFDSLSSGVALAGVRGGSDMRQLLFRAGEHDVDLRVRREAAAGGEGWSLDGQLLGPDVEAVEAGVQLRCTTHRAEAVVSPLGEFHFASVPDGECVLSLRIADALAELPPFTLASTPRGSDG